MNFKISVLAVFLGLCVQNGYSQDSAQVYFGADVGIGTLFSNPKDLSFVRRENPVYDGYYQSSTYKTYFTNYYASLKVEHLNKTKQFGIATGIRYSLASSVYDKDQSATSYLYVIDDQSETSVNYFKVTSISQNVHSVGIPVEIRFTPFVRRFVKLYFKMAVSGNLRIATDNHAEFYDPNMKVYEKVVTDKIEKPKLFNTTINSGLGLSFGYPGDYLINVDVGVPYFTSGSSSISTTIVGSSFNVSVLFPIK